MVPANLRALRTPFPHGRARWINGKSGFEPLPKEGHRVQLRADAFHAFNNIQWNNPMLSPANPTTFGEITSAVTSSLPARVMQFAIRHQL
jgi:hypothetical protein